MDRRQFICASAALAYAPFVYAKRGRVRVDDLGGADDTAKILAASAYAEVDFANRTYVFNGEFQVKAGQVIRLNGAKLIHTDNTKRFFVAVNVDDWSLIGPGTIEGLLTSGGNTGEKAVYIEACQRCRVKDVQGHLLQGPAFHIVPGARGFSSFLAETAQLSGLIGKESYAGLQIDAGTAAEYVTVLGSNFIGNITGAQIAAGNTQLVGVNVVKNYTNGLILLGGSNDGHGSFKGNINHNGGTTGYNAIIDGVDNGFDLEAHIYSDVAGQQPVWIKGASKDVQFANCRIDAPFIHDAAGANRVVNSKLYSKFAVSGSNTAGLMQSGNY